MRWDNSFDNSLFRLRCDGFGGCLLTVLGGAWAAGGTFFGIEKRFCDLMRFRGGGLLNRVFDDGVEAVRESVSTLITVEGRRISADVDAFPYSSLMPP